MERASRDLDERRQALADMPKHAVMMNAHEMLCAKTAVGMKMEELAQAGRPDPGLEGAHRALGGVARGLPMPELKQALSMALASFEDLIASKGDSDGGE